MAVLQATGAKPYPKNPAAWKAIRAQAKCRKARECSGFLSHRTKMHSIPGCADRLLIAFLILPWMSSSHNTVSHSMALSRGPVTFPLVSVWYPCYVGQSVAKSTAQGVTPSYGQREGW